MEKKRSFSLIFLIFLGIVALLAITAFFSICNSNKEIVPKETTQIVNEIQEIESSEENIKDVEYIELEIQNQKVCIPKKLESEIKWESEGISGKNIELDSEEGKLIQDYLGVIYTDDAPLYDLILEFDDIKSSPREYLFACALSHLLEEKSKESLKEEPSEINNYMYQTASYEEFNEMIIKIFGDEANGLLDEKFIENHLTSPNPDGRYDLGGYCGAEWNRYITHIKSIEKRDDIFYVEMYEYRQDYSEEYNTVWQNVGLGNEDPEMYIDYKEYFYNRSGDLITTIDYKFLTEENRYEQYYEDGEIVNETNQSFIEMFSDKISIRGLEIKYNEEAKTLNLLRNRLLTN